MIFLPLNSIRLLHSYVPPPTTTRLFSFMSAIQVHEIGDESKLLLNANTKIPHVSPTQCLVENHYAGLNFHDTYTRSGLYPLQLPFIVGCEGGGIVQKVGSQVDGIKEGDRVVYLQEGEDGSYAQYTNVEYTRLMPVPKSVNLDLATAVAVQGVTAHYLVNDSYNVQKGDWCLVHAAAGGTGQIIVQMAKQKGANVIGTCSTLQKANIAKACGCDFVILTNSDGKEEEAVWATLAQQVKQIVAENTDEPIVKANYGSYNLNDGVHCAFDGVGKDSALASLESLRPRGTAVFFGNASGPPPDIPPLLLSKLGSLTMTRPKMHDFISTRKDVLDRSSSVFKMLQKRQIEVTIQETVPLNQEGVVRATKLLHDRKTVGKVLFDIPRGLALHQTAANDIVASRQNAKKIEKLDQKIAPLTIEDGYSIQDLVNNITIQQYGERSFIGYEIAATSTFAQESVNVKEPFYGKMFSHSTFISPATIHLSSKHMGFQEQFILIEPEFAVKISKDLEVSTSHTLDSIAKNIGSIFPSIEIVTSAFSLENLGNFKKIGAPSLIADNGCHGALVLGKEYTNENDLFSDVLRDLDQYKCSLHVNDNLDVTAGTGERVLGHPLNALCWLANKLGERGESLKKDQVITTGVVVDRLVLAKVGDKIIVDYGDLLGNVTFHLER